MTTPLDELKTRARIHLNGVRHDQPDLRLRDCLNQAAREVGFLHWEQGRQVLGGEAVAGDDMGTLWHAPRCDSLLNAWFANYAEARAALESEPGAVLLPYRRQFIVANDPFIRELGLDPDDAAWAGAGHDLVGAYAGESWSALALQRLKAPASTFAAARTAVRAPPSPSQH